MASARRIEADFIGVLIRMPLGLRRAPKSRCYKRRMMHEHLHHSAHRPEPKARRQASDASGSLPRAELPKLDWRAAHEELSKLAKCRAKLDWDEGRSLLAALRSGAHLHLGFGSFGEYVERLIGYDRRSTLERLRVAEALEDLPELGEALRKGHVSWSVARELMRVATPPTEHAWLEVAQGRTVRQIEELVAGHRPGDGPYDPRESGARHVLRFDVSAETYATFREAMGKLRGDAGSPLDDDASLLLLARQILAGPRDEGRAAYQVALTVCEVCGRGWQQGRGELVEVGPEIVEMASCDGQHLGRVVSDDRADATSRDRPRGRADSSRPAGCPTGGATCRDASRCRKVRRTWLSAERVRRHPSLEASLGGWRPRSGYAGRSLLRASPRDSSRAARRRGSSFDGPLLSARRWNDLRLFGTSAGSRIVRRSVPWAAFARLSRRRGASGASIRQRPPQRALGRVERFRRASPRTRLARELTCPSSCGGALRAPSEVR
jgi:hypothetical protein